MEKRHYFYDLHCHSKASSDSPASVKSIAKMAQKRGLTGIAITDHDKLYKGDTSIAGVDIIPGIEITLKDGGHLLAFFVEKPIAKEKTDLTDAVAEIKKQGGYAVLAHPFRKEKPRLLNITEEETIEISKKVDGLEAGNAADSDQARESVFNLKKKYPGIPFFLTAGSDGHMAGQTGFAVVKTKEKINRENFSRILSEAEIVIAPESEIFRKEIFLWKKITFKILKTIKRFHPGKAKKIFHIVFLRNYFRLRNRKFSRIEIDLNQTEN